MSAFRITHYEFRPRLWAGVAAAGGIALMLALGQWQIGRAQYKAELQGQYDAQRLQPAVSIGATPMAAEHVLLRRVEVRGEFAPQYTVYVDNKIQQHQPGYHVATPLRIAGSQQYVLVNRGWIAATRDRTVPAISTPTGEQMVQGTAVAYSERYLELSTQVAEGNLWQNLVLERYRQATGLAMQPFVIQQENTAADGLQRQWQRPDLGRNTHLAYAFQWYALSLAILIYYLVTHVQRRNPAQ